MYFVILKAWFL